MDANREGTRFLALVPAAGIGSRVGAALPKQYLPLGRRTMLEHSVDALRSAPWIERVIVVVAADDSRASTLLAHRTRVEVLREGGASRRDTVLAGLHAMRRQGARADDWVLVHDAARPGLRPAMLERLRHDLADSPVGGLLGVPVGETVKQTAGDRSVAVTLDRDRLWVAQTPQMFRFGLLLEALAAHASVTDEAAAIELAGHAPRLVEGGRSNFKVTTAEDVELMRSLLQER